MHRAFSAGLIVAACLVSGSTARAQSEDSDPAAILEGMARYLAGLSSFAMTQQTTFDVVQSDGRKLEFGESRRVAVRRPDRARIDGERRDGARRGFRFDGQQIAVFDLDENVYAAVPKPGSLDAAIDYFLEDLDMRLPLAELLSSDLPRVMADHMSDVLYVTASTVKGVPCHQLSARGDGVDLQIWIERGDTPLPRRLVITYKAEPGQPQFRADLTDWLLAPELKDDVFDFEAAEGAERIPVSAPPAPGAGR